VTSLMNDFRRRLVPRWRYAASAVAPAETVADRPRSEGKEGDDSFWEEKLLNWADDPGIATAAELVSCATALNRVAEVKDAVAYLHARSTELRRGPEELVAYALTSLRRDSSGVAAYATALPMWRAGYVSGRKEARAIIARSRARLVTTPRDALAWMDMSRAYTTLGQPQHAETAISRALLLAPNSRLIVRAACRRLVHADRSDDAHRLLLRHPRTRQDPWLIAAEIALAQILEETPRLAREGRAVLESGHFSPAGITELAGALGTLEFLNGSTKRARRLFHLSMQAPSDNAVAQARWIAARTGGIEISEDAWRTPRSYEAWCWRAFQAKDWERSLLFAKEWVSDEPFSSRAAVQATFLATAVNEDYEYAIECAREVLMADGTDGMLRNNLVVALAYSDRVEEARAEAALLPKEPDPERACTHLATRGLLEMRSGRVEAGRAFYRQAFDCASPQLKLRVLSHWLKEELRLDPRGSRELLAKVRQAAEAQQDNISSRVVEMTAAKYGSLEGAPAASSESLARLDGLLTRGDG
jgi:Flp pilus assembly protein TadD